MAGTLTHWAISLVCYHLIFGDMVAYWTHSSPSRPVWLLNTAEQWVSWLFLALPPPSALGCTYDPQNTPLKKWKAKHEFQGFEPRSLCLHGRPFPGSHIPSPSSRQIPNENGTSLWFKGREGETEPGIIHVTLGVWEAWSRAEELSYRNSYIHTQRWSHGVVESEMSVALRQAKGISIHEST